MAGVTIMEKGTTNGVATDIDGKYSITLRGNKPVITASYIGYSPFEKAISASETVLDIVLKDESQELSEVVVVGYGSQKKVNLTGAVDQVTSEVFEGRPAANVTQMLEGAIPNLNISLSDGKPGRSSDFNVRGTGSINGGAALVLIDGVEGDPSLLNPDDIASVSVLKDAASAAIYGARAPFGVVLITTKNPQEGKPKINYSSIYSFQSPQNVPDVVSDGYTWAEHFYKAYYNYNFSNPSGINKTQEFSLAWLEEYKRRKETGNFGTVISDGTIGTKGRYVYYNEGLDLFDELYKKNTFATTQNLSISGSDKKFDYYLSGRFYHYDGLWNSDTQTDKFNSYNLRFKAGYQATSWLKINNNFEFAYNRTKMPLTASEGAGNVWRNIYDEGKPSMPLFNPDGTMTYSAVYGVGDLLYGNSYHRVSNHQYKNTLSFVADILKDKLKLQGDFTFQRKEYDRTIHRVRTPYAKKVDELGNSVMETVGSWQSYLNETNNHTDYMATNLFATYHQVFNKVHDFTALVGMNYEKSQYKQIAVERADLLTNDAENLNLTFSTDDYSIGSSWSAYQFGGAFFRLNYSFDNRYLVEFNGRYDGSSRFRSDSRWHMFPSLSLGWRVNEEHFWNIDPNIIQSLKLRASWGQLGNAAGLSNYQYKQTLGVGTTTLIFNGKQLRYVSAPGALPTSLTWETSTTWDGGADIYFLNRRLSVTGDYYVRKTTNMITAGPTVPDVFGTSAPKGNYADMSTYGYELTLEWRDAFQVEGKPLNYSIRATLSDYYSTIDKFTNVNKTLSTNNNQSASGNYYEGMRIGEIWGFVSNGLWQTQEEIDAAEAAAVAAGQKYYNPLMQTSKTYKLYPGDIKFEDLNGNGYIDRGKNTVDDPGDRKIIGNAAPRYIYGFRLSLDWNGIYANAFFQGVGKQDWYPSSEAAVFWGQYNRPYAQIPSWHIGNYWTEDNPDAYLPRYTGYYSPFYGGTSRANTRYLQNVAYLRCKNLQVGYNFPTKIIQKLHMQQLGIYLSGENLFTWSPLYKHSKDLNVSNIYGTDAEFGSSGDGYNYPMMKSLSVGLNVTF
ncbi:MAG: TonB-dependent receptor [Muribaculaceae bacterium]|nr:TonB-dependent receptor [Muribaculaceae bacterium]